MAAAADEFLQCFTTKNPTDRCYDSLMLLFRWLTVAVISEVQQTQLCETGFEENDDTSERKVPRAKVYWRLKGEKKSQIYHKIKKKQEKCWISTVIISLFPLPWDPLGWVTRPMFFSLAGGPASSSLCRYFQTVSIKQPLCPQVEKMKNVRVAEGRTNMSESEMLHSVSPTFSRTPFIFHLPLGEIAYVFSKFSPATLQVHLQQNSTNGNAAVYFHSLGHRHR